MDNLSQYDFLVNTHTEHLLNHITHDTGDEEVAVHVTILAFEKLWYYLDKHDCPVEGFEVQRNESVRLEG